ncbi:MAG: tetratricopeptide repeat protein, partial [Bacteriovoracia bacterium]
RRMNDAEKLLKKALALKPDNGYIVDSWGWHLFVQGRVTESIVELERAVKLKPEEPTIMDHLGDAYVKANLREKGLEQYRTAASMTTDQELKAKLEGKIDTVKMEIARANGFDPRGTGRAPAQGKTAVTETPVVVPTAPAPSSAN